MEIGGWKGGERGQAFARYPDIAAWFREWHGRAPRGRAVDPAFARRGLHPGRHALLRQVGGGIFCFRVAFDEAYARYSPGTLLLTSAMTFLYEKTDAAWVDSATNKDNLFFLGMMPERRALARLMIGTGGPVDRAVVSALPLLAKVGAAADKVQHGVASALSAAGADVDTPRRGEPISGRGSGRRSPRSCSSPPGRLGAVVGPVGGEEGVPGPLERVELEGLVVLGQDRFEFGGLPGEGFWSSAPNSPRRGHERFPARCATGLDLEWRALGRGATTTKAP